MLPLQLVHGIICHKGLQRLNRVTTQYFWANVLSALDGATSLQIAYYFAW